MKKIFFKLIFILFPIILYATIEITNNDIFINSPIIFKNNILYISAAYLSQNYNINIYYSPVSKVVLIKTDLKKGKFIIEQPTAIINGDFIEIDSPPIIFEDEVYIPIKLLNLFDIDTNKIKELTGKYFIKETEEISISNLYISDEILITRENIVNTREIENNINTTEIIINVETEIIKKSREIGIYLEKKGMPDTQIKIFENILNLIQNTNTSEIITISLLSSLSPEIVNKKNYDLIIILKPYYSSYDILHGITFFLGGYNIKKNIDLLSGIANSLKYSDYLKKLGYDGPINAFVLQLSYYQFLLANSILIECFNMNNSYDKTWILNDKNQEIFAKYILNIVRMIYEKN